MASTTLILNGFSIAGDANTNTPARDGGAMFIHSGDRLFEDDDIIVFLVEGATEDGVLTDASVITGMIVYDNAYDYYHDIAKYEYSYDGPEDGIDLDVGRKTMGDTYLEFDAELLVSEDAGAPELGQLTLASGLDIFTTLDQDGVVKIDTFTDVDYNRDGAISGNEAADGAFSAALNDLVAICFARGTLIETPSGPRAIETLREGDPVSTLDHGAQPIRWIGGATFDGRGASAPIRIRAGALGNLRDLTVSPNHRMLVSGAMAELLFGEPEVLVAAKHLVNDSSIRRRPCARVEYFHILCDRHEIVFAEGAPAETLFPGPQALEAVSDGARDEILAVFPQVARSGPVPEMSRTALRGFEAAALRRA